MRKIRTAFFAVVSLAVIILNLSAIFGDFGPKVLYADVKPPGYRYKKSHSVLLNRAVDTRRDVVFLERSVLF
jgi:hypothetical protein